MVFAVVCCACGGADDAGSGGAGSGGSGASSGTGGQPYPLDSLDEPCGPSGITGQGVLDAIVAEYQAALEGDVTAALTIGIGYDGGDIVCHPPYSTGETGPAMSEEVEVFVQVDFATSDGAFDEVFTAALT